MLGKLWRTIRPRAFWVGYRWRFKPLDDSWMKFKFRFYEAGAALPSPLEKLSGAEE